MPRNDRNLFKRQLVRLKGWLTLGSVGITPRLVAAFATVAALAATAWLIVENGAAMLEQQRTVERVRSAQDTQAINTLRESVGRARQAVTSAELSMTLGEFDRLVRLHADSDARSVAARFAGARAALERVTQRFRSENASAEPELPALIEAHQKTATSLVQATRLQRELRARHASLLAAMDVRVKSALEGTSKLFGRAIGGQPLQELQSRLEAVQQAAQVPNAWKAGDAASSQLVQAERALGDSLRAHEKALRRSSGAEWFQRANEDFTALVTARASLQTNEMRRAATAADFARESRKLTGMLPADLAIEAPPLVPSAPSVVSAGAASDGGAQPQRSLVGWMSAAVLIVLFYICFATIFSIVRPVRRLIAATHRLARGEKARVAPTGSIRELDTLTHAFNTMAEQLAVAREAALDAQQRLEAKVEERTRQLQELSERDPLTGIANRRQLFVALNETLAGARVSGERVGVFFLDVDNFKTLNDSLGHSYGDRVLVAIARRLEAITAGRGFAARLGGDEFTIVHRGGLGVSTDDILAFGNSVVHAFETPLHVDERDVIVSVSVGASIFPDHEHGAEALLRAADAALFRAKALGRSQLTLFTPELLATASAKFAIEQRLRRAIQNAEFELYYQPLIDLQTLEVAQVEALLRWRMPDGGHRLPEEFLAVAEESGLIVEISDWVLRSAIRAAADWHRGAWPRARIAINVSPRQFLDYRFAATLQTLLAEFRLPASCVELEITENVLQTGPHTIKTLDQLRAIGVAIALDDFGTGYSSLASLQQLPLTRVKLDRSLIADMDGSGRAASIARATIALCRSLGLDVTVEGVERLEQFEMLLPHRAISLQGYLFSRPVPASSLMATIETLPAHCRVLMEQSQQVSAQVPAALRAV